MNILLGRQSILDRDQQLFGYELLFRSPQNNIIECDTEATASVLSNTLSMMSIDNILADKLGFVNIGIDFLRKGLLEILPPQRFVIEILENQKPDAELIDFVEKLKKKGYIFALDDVILSDENLKYWEPILERVEIVKVDVIDTYIDNLKNKTELLQKFNVKLLAEKVETQEMFDLCYNLGYTYFQGYFFTKPILLESPSLSPDIQGIMHLIQLLQEDADVDKIEASLRLYPQLIIALLKLVNSASVSPIQEITSIRQAIILLGHKALCQWLLLLLYSQKNAQKLSPLQNDPIFLTAIERGKTMELLVKAHDPKISRTMVDEAFLVGILSLVDIILHSPLKIVLKELKVAPTISDALLKQEGLLGETFYITKMLETGHFHIVSQMATNLNISIEKINNISYNAFKFSSNLAGEM